MTNSRIQADLFDLNGKPITPAATLVLRRTASGKLRPAESAPNSLRRIGAITNGTPIPSASKFYHRGGEKTEVDDSSEYLCPRSEHSADSLKSTAARECSIGETSSSAWGKHGQRKLDTQQQRDSLYTTDYVGLTATGLKIKPGPARKVEIAAPVKTPKAQKAMVLEGRPNRSLALHDQGAEQREMKVDCDMCCGKGALRKQVDQMLLTRSNSTTVIIDISEPKTSEQHNTSRSSPGSATSDVLPCGCLRSTLFQALSSVPITELPAYPSTTASFSSTAPGRITPVSSSSGPPSTPTSLHRSSTSFTDFSSVFSPPDTAFSPVSTGEDETPTYHWQYYIPHISTSTSDYYTDCSWIAFDVVRPQTGTSGCFLKGETEAEAEQSPEERIQMAQGMLSPIPRTPEEVELPEIGDDEFEYYPSPIEGAGQRYPFVNFVGTEENGEGRYGRKEILSIEKGRDETDAREHGFSDGTEDPQICVLKRGRGETTESRKRKVWDHSSLERKGRLVDWLGRLTLRARKGHEKIRL
ncbi:uncharacterized protein EI97DRAFT_445049 [Westerdykella ornata]|uniref:Uncharacterized protein n=1 Tax=Westerdykella ornata TaxID=318751 RepID=A0A6A6JA88_WESOR|nr:uncharacterized protein EI97DRAFT_445049 [Westerdykella ornata]KAF2273312.1 hypothetical protein EI97DRAFT_445049 [Westerdykella ornata]